MEHTTISVAAAPSVGPRPAFGHSAEWCSLQAQYEAARAAEIAFGQEVYGPAAATADAEALLIPHYRTSRSHFDVHGNRVSLTTEKHSPRFAQEILQLYDGIEDDQLTPAQRDQRATLVELVQLHTRREEQKAAIHRRHNLEALGARWEALGEARLQSEDQLRAMPAPDGAAAAWKLEHMLRDDDCDTLSAAVVTDVRRVLLEHT